MQFLAIYYATNVEGRLQRIEPALVGAPLCIVYVLLPLGIFKEFTVHDEVYSSQTSEERETQGLRL